MITKYLLTYKCKDMITTDGVFYNLKNKGNKTALYYDPEDYNWSPSVRGTKGCNLKRINDDVLIQIANQKLKLDYSELEMLLVLLIHENETDNIKTIINKVKNVN
ncbi:MAG: hypothetical protein GY707_05585 [Desulfobacteraceae bacterium]|nr:hypothetical protein [Desulfobacteraceae bacterium]